MDKKTVGIAAIITLVIFIFLGVVYTLTNSTTTKVYDAVNKVLPSDHLTWSPDKKILLVEYGDLQCPACKLYHDYIKSDLEAKPNDITKKITFIYREFPLPNVHEHANEAAYAAEAAALQGKFYEMTDLMYTQQQTWEKDSNVKNYFTNLAKRLKLDTEKFKKDMDSKAVKDKVDADVTSGMQADVNATPTFYLNGQKLDNINSFDDFKKYLEDATTNNK